jgi:cytochrome c peroxidase
MSSPDARLNAHVRRKLWTRSTAGWCAASVVVIGAFALLAQVGWSQVGTFPPDLPPPPGSLKTVPVPLPPNLDEFVADRKAAIVLGKALFWDQGAGSDGLACASCHFHAGADDRVKNQLDPGLRNVAGGTISQTFNLTASNRNSKFGPPPGGGPNYTLKKADFPFHQLADPNDANSKVLFDTDDVVSSQGVFHRDFLSELLNPKKLDRLDSANGTKKGTNALSKDKKREACEVQPSVFNVGGNSVRQVEPRNTPTTINAIFNFRNFWDGRANNIFNGRNVWGPRDPSAGIDPANSIQVEDTSGNLRPYPVSIPDASLASQAVGPPLSDLEMSCGGRAFENLGQKLLAATPLIAQIVDPTDSVLGPYARTGKKSTGLNVTYTQLIQKAFQPKFWNSTKFTAEGDTQMVKNFSLFWGLSIMLYESTLVSDDTPFDRYMDGNIQAMTDQQIRGLGVFLNNGGCIFCHKGAEFTGAATSLKTAQSQGGLVEHMIMGDGNVALYDSGFYNIGVRPPADDIGAGGMDPFANSLSWTRQTRAASLSMKASGGTVPYKFGVAGALPQGLVLNSATGTISGWPVEAGTFQITESVVDSSSQQKMAVRNCVITVSTTSAPDLSQSCGTSSGVIQLSSVSGNNLFNIGPDLFNIFTCNFQVAACVSVTPEFRDSVDGSFKVPTLRNVELTGPYFHNGGVATLEQLVDFYNRGGDARGTAASNTTGFGPNATNRAPAIQPLGLSAADKANLVAFLKALTDERVRWEIAPFDHPSLQIPNGHQINENRVIPDGNKGYAKDEVLTVDAVGAEGRAAKKLPPLASFDAGLK